MATALQTTAASQNQTGVKCEVWHRPWESSQPSGIILTYCFTHERAPSIFHISSNQGCTDTRAPGDFTHNARWVCHAVRLDGILSSVMHVQTYGLGMLSAMHISWICWLFMNIFPPCQHQSHCIHTQLYTGISDVLAGCRAPFPVANIETSLCVRVESLFPSTCQDVPQDFVLNPDAFFP